MVLIPSFKRLLNPYQYHDLQNAGPLIGCFLFGLLSLLYVTTNSLPTNDQHLAAKDFPSSHSSDRRRLVYPSATFTDPLVKLEVHNEPEQDDFQSDEEYEIVSISGNSDEILEKEIWTSSAENDADISEVKEEYSKAKRAVNKNTAKPKKKHKHSVKNTNKKAKKPKKTISETAKKRPPVKSKNEKKKAKKAISKHSNKNPAKNDKKSPKPNNKNPEKRVKSGTRRAKIVEKPAKSKQKVNNKIKQTTKRASTVLKRTKPPKKATLSAFSTVEKGKENNSVKKTYFRHRPLTSNDRVLADDCDASISNGSFKLSFDVKPSDFFDERFQLNPNLKDEKCTFNILNNKEINIIVIDIVRNQATRFKRTLKDDELKEIIVHRRRGKKVRVRQQTNNETLEKITTISYRADESFDGPKLPLRNEYESETASYGADKSFFRTESPLRKEHESETALYREDESIVRMKPPVLKEHESETISYGEDESFFRMKQPLLKEHESETASYGEDESFIRIKPPLQKEHESGTVSYGVDESFIRIKPPLRKEHESETVSYGADESFIRIKPPLRKEHESETVSYGADESFVRIKSPLRKEHESETVSYRADESFVRIKPPLRKEHESETTSYGEDESFVRKKPPLRKEHEREMISNRAYASFVRLKPPFRMEQSQKHHEKSENWLVKQIVDQHHGDNYRTVTLEENASGNNDKVFQESGTEEQESSPSIQFESFADLKNFINANILKVKGPHMLLLSKKFDPLLSEKTNTNDFLSKLNEKLLKIPRKFTITLSHFVPAKYIQKNTFYDILQTFQMSTEINPLSSNVENKSYVTQRVSGTCVFIPLLRQSFSQISTSPQGSVQLKLLDSKSLSKEYADDLQGKFVLQMKQPCKAMEPPVSSMKNGAEKDQKAVRDMKSSTDATADLDSAATTQPPTNSEIQYRMADGKQFFPERTYQQQSVGIDYWMPEEVFGILFSKLFVNTTMPQGVHKIFGSKATTSGIETPNQLLINNPPISQRESGESEKNNELHTVEDGNFRSLFKLKQKQAASNNEKIAGNDGADVYYEFRDGAIGDFTLDKGRLTPPDDDSFIESPADNEYEISQQEFGFEKRDSVMDNYDLDDFHGSFQLKTKGKTSNKEELPIGNNHRLLKHYSNHLESQDKDADDSTMRKKYQSMKSESPVNNSTKQKDFLGMFKLKSSFKTSNIQGRINNNTFIKPLKNINKLIPELKQKPGLGKSTSDKNENDFFQGMFKLKTKNKGLSSGSSVNIDKPVAKEKKHGSLKDNDEIDSIFTLKKKSTNSIMDNDEVENFHFIFRLKQKGTNDRELSRNIHSILGNGGLAEPSVDVDKAVAEQKKHQPLKDREEVENFHGAFTLKKNGPKHIGLSKNRIIDLLNDENELNEEDEGALLKICKSLRHGSPLHASNPKKFHGLFRLKPKLRRSLYQVNHLQKLTSAQEFEPELLEKFHGLFRIKTEQEVGESGNAEMTRNFSPDENTFMDKYEVVFRLKPRKNESDSLGKLYKLKTFPEWCKNYKRRKEPFWFS